MEDYFDVDDVTITFARNGASLQFWGRYGENGSLEKFTMVFPDVRTAFDIVEALYEQKNKQFSVDRTEII